MGTHLDALCHVTAGEDCHGFGGFNGVDDVGDKGVLANDVTEVPPILARGVLLDVAAALGVPELPPEHAITASELEAGSRQGRRGTAPGRRGACPHGPPARLADVRVRAGARAQPGGGSLAGRVRAFCGGLRQLGHRGDAVGDRRAGRNRST